ncbi:recombinase family protein [Paenibacillus sp. NPDC058910]|uniref:recombinase family protein n=1 Tax=unclassified Paenibacillus TaxID=185978 RepID=UPI0036D0DD63
MKQGKEAGAKKGMWTNGKPPFPYYYDKNTRSVLVDETKRPIYRAIVKINLNGTNLGHIAIWLTDNKIPMPYNIKPDGKNKGWSNITVQRLLASEIHWGTSLMAKPVPSVVRWSLYPKKSGLKSWEHMKS